MSRRAGGRRNGRGGASRDASKPGDPARERSRSADAEAPEPGQSFAELASGIRGLRRLHGRRPIRPEADAKRSPLRRDRPPDDHRHFVFPRPDQPLLAYAAGVRKGDLKRLQRGEIRPRASIDLHGHDRSSARRALSEAIETASRERVQCLLVIHGRGLHAPGGHGVLKSALPDWLCRPPMAVYVRAIAPARPADGGAGALYVWIAAARGG